LGLHAVHQDRADHAAPADQADGVSDAFHLLCAPFNQSSECLTGPAGSSWLREAGARRTRLGQPFLVVVVMEEAMNSPEPAQRRAVGSKRSAAFIVGQIVMERPMPA
ncbi:MAG TPA: hypothetical protein PLA28_16255, partial [Ottowia sp.]|nr:hypothetical protein [Ottowia sp.]